MSQTHDLTLFVSGMLATGYAVAALHFLKFWRETRDRLFAFFAMAFALLLVQRVALALLSDGEREGAVGYYLLRLLAFMLILVAIVDKNRSRRQ
ncbi:MAG: DUF5985 family protein [Gemmatimonadaceae bacterium]